MFVLEALVWTSAAAAQDRTQSRWMVISVNGIVAGEQPLAAQIDAGILASGGNAVASDPRQDGAAIPEPITEQ